MENRLLVQNTQFLVKWSHHTIKSMAFTCTQDTYLKEKYINLLEILCSCSITEGKSASMLVL